MLSTLLDIFRLRQYFNVVTRTLEVVEGIRDDAGLLHDARRAVVRLPFEARPALDLHPFPPFRALALKGPKPRRLALVATGGSGALASVVGAARALEEADLRPSVISVCSGSSLFGFPIAAGIPADEVAAFAIGLEPEEYVDVDWRMLASVVPKLAQGFAGILKGDHIEEAFRRLVGDVTLAELPIPAYAPIWNIEQNRLEYIGPRSHPDLGVARAIHMAVALPLFVEPVALDGGYWCDGGIVDIFPVRPVLDIEEPCDAVLAVNGFYPPRFVGEDASGWKERRGSILHVASQVRTSQQVELARANLARLEEQARLMMIEPVPYEKVRGVGFYRQFLSTREWGAFMRAGRVEARRALTHAYGLATASRAHPPRADLEHRSSGRLA